MPKTQQFFKDIKTSKSKESFKSQCFLIENIDTLINSKIPSEDCYKNFLCIDGDPSELLGRVMRRSPQEKFLQEILPHELSALVPEFRMFKVDYDPTDIRGYSEQEFFFDTTITKNEVEMMTTNRQQRAAGIGLKSCTWEFIGSNPAESKRLVKVNVKILFSSMQDMLKISPSGISFLDLIKPKGRKKQNVDSKYHQVKQIVGWACPSSQHMLFQNKPGLLEAIKNTKLSMFLTLVKHDLNFQQDGRVEMQASFWGRLESAFSNAGDYRFDVLELDNEQERLRSLHSYNATIKELEARTKLLTCIQQSAVKTKNKHVQRVIQREQKKAQQNAKYNQTVRDEFLVSQKKLRYEKFMQRLQDSNKIRFVEVKERDGATLIQCKGGYTVTTPPDQAFINKFKSLSTLTTNSKGKLSNNKIQSRPEPQDERGNLIIQYFFLGDLQDVVQDDFYIQNKKKKEYFSRIQVGSLTHPYNSNKRMCIADIPIDLRTFAIWFSKSVINKSKETYAFNDFIRDIMTSLIQPIMSDVCLRPQIISNQRTVEKIRMRPKITLFQLEGKGKDGRVDPITERSGYYKDEYEKSRQDNTNNCINVQNPETIKVPQVNQKNYIKTPCDSSTFKSPFNYFFVYATEEKNFYRNVNYKKDQESGMYHFIVGPDRGVLKEINFEQNNLPGLKESMMQGTGLEWLKRCYNAKIKMYGNATFIPGQKIFINTDAIGIGKPNEEGSIAFQLGLGGYYIIVKVEGTIESGKFETEITARWESRGDGIGYKDNNNDIERCIEEYRKSVQSTSGRFANLTNKQILEYFNNPATTRHLLSNPTSKELKQITNQAVNDVLNKSLP